MDRYARELEELFSQSLEIDGPADLLATEAAEKRAPLVLYGAGSLGRFVLGRLRDSGVEPVAFADETPSKRGQLLEGVPILGLADAIARYGNNAVFAVTILNPDLRFVEAERRLRQLGVRSVISFLHLARHFPDRFLPYLQFEAPQQLVGRRADIARGLRLFADQESRRQFVAHIRFRLQLAFEALVPTSAATCAASSQGIRKIAAVTVVAMPTKRFLPDLPRGERMPFGLNTANPSE